MKEVEVIGVDVGNGYTKTVNSCFRSGIVRYDTKPIASENVVFYDGKYYGVGGRRSTAKTDKKQDETSLIFALAGIGKEIQKRNRPIHDVILSEGFQSNGVPVTIVKLMKDITRKEARSSLGLKMRNTKST